MTGPWRQAAARHPDGAAAAGLGALALLLFAPAVLGGRVFFERDILGYWYPHVENAVQAVAEGTWPTWTPYVAFGRPLLADPNLQLLYPPTWLNLVLPPGACYTLFVVAHAFVAGFGLHRLGRHLGLAPLAAAVAGALWMASGPFLSTANLFHHFAGAAWMPWVLRAAAHALARPSLRAGLGVGALAAVQALAGSADMCVFTGLAAAIHAAAHLGRGPGHLRQRLAAGARMTLVAVPFAALLAAAQWLPAAALARGTPRAAQGPPASTAWSVHPATLADLFVPGLVTDLPLTADRREALFDGRPALLASLYVGIASLPLVALAVTGGGRPPGLWVLAALAVSVVAALGRHAAAAPAFSVPPLSLLRYPAKHMVVAALFWALLAGAGLHVCTAERAGAARRRAAAVVAGGSLIALALLAAAVWVARAPAATLGALTGGAAGAAAGAVAGKLTIAAGLLAAGSVLLGFGPRRAGVAGWVPAALTVVIVGDVAAAGRDVNAFAVPALVRHRPAAARQILAESDEPRLHVRAETVGQLNEWLLRGRSGWDSAEGWALGVHDLLLPPMGARWRIAGSYDGDFTGLARPALSTFSRLLPASADDPLALKLLRLGAVTHVTSLREHPYAGLERRAAFPSVFTRPVSLHRVPDPLPRVYVVGAARTAATEAAVMAAIAEPGFDPRREVVLAAKAPVPPAPARFLGTARVVSRGMDRLAAEVESSAPAWLVVVEAWDAGWTARVDGEAAEVLPANALFRAVAVPAGRHRVDMTYRPPGLMAGLLLSACALVLGLSLAAAGRRDAPKLSAGRARDSMRARLAGATRGTSSREASEPPFPRSEGAE